MRTVSLARALTWRSSLSSAAMAGVSVAALGSRRSKRVTEVHGSSSPRFAARRAVPPLAPRRPLSLLCTSHHRTGPHVRERVSATSCQPLLGPPRAPRRSRCHDRSTHAYHRASAHLLEHLPLRLCLAGARVRPLPLPLLLPLPTRKARAPPRAARELLPPRAQPGRQRRQERRALCNGGGRGGRFCQWAPQERQERHRHGKTDARAASLSPLTRRAPSALPAARRHRRPTPARTAPQMWHEHAAACPSPPRPLRGRGAQGLK